MHIGLLKSNLISLFMVDELRRITCESLLPFLMQNKKVKSEIIKLQDKLLRKNSTSQETTKSDQDAIIDEEMEEVEKDETEIFDDYLEFVMTYGYITLYAAAFPIGSAITLFFIYLEVRSDIFKLEKNARRPVSKKVHTIGTWEYALMGISYVSIFTNISLAFLASDQVDYLMPWLAERKNFNKDSILAMFTIEHIMLLFVILFHLLKDTDPKWLRIFKERRQYKLAKKESKTEL